MASKPPTPPAKAAAGGAAAAVAAMLLIAAPFVAGWEGLRTDPYRDSIGKLTVCIGETNVPMKSYTVAQCHEMFGKSFLTYAKAVSQLSPGIENSPYEWAAHASIAYNVGVAAYGKSSIRRLYNEGRGVEACRAFRLYRKAGGREIPGLVFRREGEGQRVGEYELCLAGAVPKVFPL